MSRNMKIATVVTDDGLKPGVDSHTWIVFTSGVRYRHVRSIGIITRCRHAVGTDDPRRWHITVRKVAQQTGQEENHL